MRTLFKTCSFAVLLLPLAALPVAGCDSDSDSDSGAGDTGGDGDGDGDVDPAEFPNLDCSAVEGECVMVPSSDAAQLQEVTNDLNDGMTIVLGSGTFTFDNQVTLRGATDITLRGQGMDETVLDFGSVAAQSNGVDSVGDGFEVGDFTILDAPKDGLRVEDSDSIVIRRLRATWTNEGDMNNGAYGIYPVKVSRVLMEDSEAFNSSDAGIYVGQCQHAVVRNNIARGNVAGIEIENTQYADVYGNLAEDNTGGLVAFDLPGNPVIGRDVLFHDNMVINNNRVNFAPGGTVGVIPPGTGSFAMASRRIEFRNNTYMNNDTVDIALISGLVVDSDPSAWALTKSELVGTWEDLDIVDQGDTVENWRSDNVWVHDNSHMGSGTDPASKAGPAQELGLILGILYAGSAVDNLVYDSSAESVKDATDPTTFTNDRHVCLTSTNEGATVAAMDVAGFASGDIPNPTFANDVFQPASPFTPFDCNDLGPGGPVVAPDMDPDSM